MFLYAALNLQREVGDEPAHATALANMAGARADFERFDQALERVDMGIQRRLEIAATGRAPKSTSLRRVVRTFQRV